MDQIEGILLTPLKIIEGRDGNVLHALKRQEESFVDFGEAYFSTVNHGAVKGWKKHRRMTLNLVVPLGAIWFVLYDDRAQSPTYKIVQELMLSPEARESYQRLTVPPGVWMSFKGMGERLNLLLNIASIPHDPTEAENLHIGNDLIPYDWK
jgi:dTDP-4-dehydrorhamnose 3,5-epimerase